MKNDEVVRMLEDIYIDLEEYLSGGEEEVANMIAWHLESNGIQEKEDSDIFKTKRVKDFFGDEEDV